MRGKKGHWGKPFDKTTANLMRERGLAVRRAKAAERFMRLAAERSDLEEAEGRQEQVRWEMRQVRPGVLEQVVLDSPRLRVEPRSAPARNPAEALAPKPAKASPASKTEPTSFVPGAPCAFGYELAPGKFLEVPPPAKLCSEPGTANHVGLLRQQRLRAQERRASYRRQP